MIVIKDTCPSQRISARGAGSRADVSIISARGVGSRADVWIISARGMAL